MPIANGNTVRVHYTGTLADQTEFDTSRGREPLEFVMGEGNLIPGFEQALIGREKGDRLTVAIPAAEAYGEHLSDLVMEIPLNETGNRHGAADRHGQRGNGSDGDRRDRKPCGS